MDGGLLKNGKALIETLTSGRLFLVFISHVIKTKNHNRSINKLKNRGYER